MMPLNWMEAPHTSCVKAEKEIQTIRDHRNELLLTTAECEPMKVSGSPRPSVGSSWVVIRVGTSLQVEWM